MKALQMILHLALVLHTVSKPILEPGSYGTPAILLHPQPLVSARHKHEPDPGFSMALYNESYCYDYSWTTVQTFPGPTKTPTNDMILSFNPNRALMSNWKLELYASDCATSVGWFTDTEVHWEDGVDVDGSWPGDQWMNVWEKDQPSDKHDCINTEDFGCFALVNK